MYKALYVYAPSLFAALIVRRPLCIHTNSRLLVGQVTEERFEIVNRRTA